MPKFSPAFRDALSQINGTQNVTAIRRALNLLSIETSNTNHEERTQIVSEAQTQLNMLLLQLNDLTVEVQNLGNAADRGLESLLYNIAEAIADYRSAYEAVNHYNLIWFQTLPMSSSAKIRIANTLINSIKKIMPPTNLWVRIQNHDNDTLNEIAYNGHNRSMDIVGSNT